jgi:hypothetical protein
VICGAVFFPLDAREGIQNIITSFCFILFLFFNSVSASEIDALENDISYDYPGRDNNSDVRCVGGSPTNNWAQR